MFEWFDAVHALGTWSTATIWLPLLAWTILALPFYVVLQHAERWHPFSRYRLLQALLFTLPTGLVAATWIDTSSLLAGPTTVSMSPDATTWMVLPAEPAPAAPSSSNPLSVSGLHAIGLLTVFALMLGLMRLVRLARSGCALVRLHANTSTDEASRVQQITDRLARDLGVKRPVQVELTDAAVVPLTYGVHRSVILLPRSLADQPEALRMTLTHELIHVRRYDYLARWAEHLIAAVFAVHPGLPRLTRAIERAREMACDAEVLHSLRGRRKAYADLLYGFSTQAASHPAFAVSIAETSSSLKERIRAMTRLNQSDLKHPRYTIVGAAILLVTLGLGIVACSDAVDPPTEGDSPPASTATPSEGAIDRTPFLVADDLPAVRDRNLLKVLVNSQGDILVGDNPLYGENPSSSKQIRAEVQYHVSNYGTDPGHAEAPEQAVIFVKTALDTPEDIYLRVLDEVRMAYHEMWDGVAASNRLPNGAAAGLGQTHPDYAAYRASLESGEEDLIRDRLPAQVYVDGPDSP